MHGEVLFYFAYASEKRGDLERAQEYLDRAKQAGTSIKNFKRSFIIKSDSHEIMQFLERLGLDQTSFSGDSLYIATPLDDLKTQQISQIPTGNS